MKRIKIFLASSNELVTEREKFEIEIYRKCKAWFEKKVFFHLAFPISNSLVYIVPFSRSLWKFTDTEGLLIVIKKGVNFNT